MYNEGFSSTDISNDVKVTVRGVNKIINRYAHHGTLIPFCHGGSEADVVTDAVLHCIEIRKLQRPSIYAREIFYVISFIYLFCHTTNIMKTVKGKIKRMDLTIARRPKGNYEAYII